MEIKTLEQFFIAKYKALEDENVKLRDELDRCEEENNALHEELKKVRDFMSKYLSVEFEACGHNGERTLLLDKGTNEWFAYGKEEKAKAAQAIEYALSMGAKDETKTEQMIHEDD